MVRLWYGQKFGGAVMVLAEPTHNRTVANPNHMVSLLVPILAAWTNMLLIISAFNPNIKLGLWLVNSNILYYIARTSKWPALLSLFVLDRALGLPSTYFEHLLAWCLFRITSEFVTKSKLEGKFLKFKLDNCH